MSSSNSATIGIDVMGCDADPIELIQSLLRLLSPYADQLSLVFYTAEAIAKPFRNHRAPLSTAFVTSPEYVTPEDDSITAFRTKPQSSLFRGLKALQQGTTDAFISCGNTGALLVGSTHIMQRLPMVRRAALITLLPTKKRPVALLDAGANITCNPETLLQFAYMGIAYQKSLGIPSPRVGLLNIGTEKTKGRRELIDTYALLEKRKERLSFFGNIEGREVFQGAVDVLITDGFTGNIFLKTAEGLSSFLLDRIENELPQGNSSLQKLRRDTNYAEYPGALLCGLNKPVIKCHGASDGVALKNAVLGAVQLHEKKFCDTFLIENLPPLP